MSIYRKNDNIKSLTEAYKGMFSPEKSNDPIADDYAASQNETYMAPNANSPMMNDKPASLSKGDMGSKMPDQSVSQPPEGGLDMLGTYTESFLDWFLWFMENQDSLDFNNMGSYMQQIYNIIGNSVPNGQFNQDSLNHILANWGQPYV